MAFRYFSENDRGELCYREQFSPWARGFAAVMGLAMFVIPIPFIQHAAWRSPTIETLVAVVGVVAPVLVGAVFLFMAFARTRQMVFESAQRQIRLTTHGPPLPLPRQARIGYGLVERVAVLRRESSEDAPDYLVLLKITGRRPMQLGLFASHAEAAHWQRRIEAETGCHGPADEPQGDHHHDHPDHPPGQPARGA